MKYCCIDLEEAIDYNDIETAKYPSGIEYYLTTDNPDGGRRVYYCPFCGEDLQ